LSAPQKATRDEFQPDKLEVVKPLSAWVCGYVVGHGGSTCCAPGCVLRRSYAMQRSSDALARKDPCLRVRGSVVRVGDWMTLDMVLAGYEAGRKEGDPEFEGFQATQIIVGGKVQARYTARQGQFLAFIYYYTKLNGQPPAELNMAQYFKISAPTIHEMVLTLEKKGLIARTPGAARSIRVLLPREHLPDLE
jgi:hypothetical protein